MTYHKQQGIHVVQHNGELVKVWDFAKNNWMRVEDCRLVPKSEANYLFHERHLNPNTFIGETSPEIGLTDYQKDIVNSVRQYWENYQDNYELTQADYQFLKEVLKEVLNPLEEVLQYKNAFSREEVFKMVAKRNKLAALQWKIKKAIT